MNNKEKLEQILTRISNISPCEVLWNIDDLNVAIDNVCKTSKMCTVNVLKTKRHNNKDCYCKMCNTEIDNNKVYTIEYRKCRQDVCEKCAFNYIFWTTNGR